MATNRSSKKKLALQAEVTRVYRDAILTAAKSVFGEHGFEKAKMVDIAKRAGMAAGTLYNYFESKEQIFQSLVEGQIEEAHRRFAQAAERGHPPKDTLRSMVRSVFAFMEEQRDMVGILMQMGAPNTWSITKMCGPRVVERRNEMRQLFEATLSRASKAGELRKDIPITDLVAILSGSMNGFIESWMHGDRSNALVDQADVVVEVFFNGAAKQ
jgi:AcrR family transcriptional regulator